MNKNAYCIGLLAFFIGVLPAAAAKLVVTRSAGSQGDSIARDAQKMLEADLQGHQVIIKARPKSWAWSKGKGTLAQRIARTANTGKIELVVDCLLFKQSATQDAGGDGCHQGCQCYQRRKTLSRKRKTAQQRIRSSCSRVLSPKVKEHLAQPAAPSPEPASAAATEPEVVAGGGELDESDPGPADAASETLGGASAGKSRR
ncbi:MAG: hypothetical protein R3C68_02105 [Myxococcota bacterium]